MIKCVFSKLSIVIADQPQILAFFASVFCFLIAYMSYLLSKPTEHLGWDSYSSAFGAFVFAFAVMLGTVFLILGVVMQMVGKQNN